MSTSALGTPIVADLALPVGTRINALPIRPSESTPTNSINSNAGDKMSSPGHQSIATNSRAHSTNVSPNATINSGAQLAMLTAGTASAARLASISPVATAAKVFAAANSFATGGTQAAGGARDSPSKQVASAASAQQQQQTQRGTPIRDAQPGGQSGGASGDRVGAVTPVRRTASNVVAVAPLAHLAIVDVSELPDQVVSRAAYLDLRRKLLDERAQFLREESALRQLIVRLELSLQNAKDERREAVVTAYAAGANSGGGGAGGNPGSLVSVGSMRGFSRGGQLASAASGAFNANDEQQSTLYASFDFSAAGTATLPPSPSGGASVSAALSLVPGGGGGSASSSVAVPSMQLVALKEITSALQELDTIEAERAAHDNAIAIIESNHRHHVEGLMRERAIAVAETMQKVHEEQRRIDALKKTMTVERERYRQEAAAAAKAQLDDMRLRCDKLAHRLDQTTKELAAANGKLAEARAEDSRKANAIAQLQQQMSVLMEERSEMKAALQSVSLDQQRREVREKQLLEEMQGLRDTIVRYERMSGGGSAPGVSPASGKGGAALSSSISLGSAAQGTQSAFSGAFVPQAVFSSLSSVQQQQLMDGTTPRDRDDSGSYNARLKRKSVAPPVFAGHGVATYAPSPPPTSRPPSTGTGGGLRKPSAAPPPPPSGRGAAPGVTSRRTSGAGGINTVAGDPLFKLSF